jgi:Zn-dependent peptidase ImmA (M78 family)
MIPEKVKVAGVEYKTELVEKMEERFNLLGQILYTRGIIHLSNDIPQDRREQTFIHELLHGIFHEAGYEEQDEEMINRVGIVLYQVLKDNHLYFGE